MTTVDEQFDQFWQAFPRGRKSSKGAARRLFVAIVNGKHRDLQASADELILGALRYAQAMGDGHPYVKMPSTWLNQGCWEDEDLAPPSANNLPALAGQGRVQSTRERSLKDDLTDHSWAN